MILWRPDMSITTLAIRSACLLLICGMPAQQPAAAASPGTQEMPGVQAVGAGISHAARPQAEDWVLENKQLRVLLRSDNLTLSVEDLSTQEAWGSDPWENSAG